MMSIPALLKQSTTLFLPSDVWDNLIWPIAVSIILGLGALIWKKVSSRKKKKFVPVIRLKITKEGHIRTSKDSKFVKKMLLAAKIFEVDKKNGIKVKLVPEYTTWGMDRISKKEDKLKLNEKTKELEKKLEILLKIDHLVDRYPYTNLKMAFDAIVTSKPQYYESSQNFLNEISLDIYGVEKPKVSFPIDISKEHWEQVKANSTKDSNKLEAWLLMDRAVFATIFRGHQEIYCTQLVPGLVQKIYELQTYNGFDLEASQWSQLGLYYVGKR